MIRGSPPRGEFNHPSNASKQDTRVTLRESSFCSCSWTVHEQPLRGHSFFPCDPDYFALCRVRAPFGRNEWSRQAFGYYSRRIQPRGSSVSPPTNPPFRIHCKTHLRASMNAVEDKLDQSSARHKYSRRTFTYSCTGSPETKPISSRSIVNLRWVAVCNHSLPVHPCTNIHLVLIKFARTPIIHHFDQATQNFLQ